MFMFLLIQAKLSAAAGLHASGLASTDSIALNLYLQMSLDRGKVLTPNFTSPYVSITFQTIELFRPRVSFSDRCWRGVMCKKVSPKAMPRFVRSF